MLPYKAGGMEQYPVDPGNVTATVTRLPDPRTPVKPEELSVQRATALAYDLAIEMFDRKTILQKHGVSEETAADLEQKPYFKKLIEQAAREWFSPSNVRDRLALEAALAVENAMPDLLTRMKDRTELMSSVVSATKVLADIAGVNNQQQQHADGEKFTITINLGADTQVFDKTIEVTAAPGSAGAIREIPEGPGDLTQVLPGPQGTGDDPPVSIKPEGT